MSPAHGHSDPLSPLDYFSQPSEQRWPVPRLFPPFVPALHVLPGVADVSIERGIGSGIVHNLADRATVGEVRSAILGDYLRDSHALYVQHAVRHEPIATTHALHVQHSVRLSQAEAEIADAQSTSRGNTAAAGVSTLMDPFAIGAPAPTIDAPATPRQPPTPRRQPAPSLRHGRLPRASAARSATPRPTCGRVPPRPAASRWRPAPSADSGNHRQ
jgi:hypothetical protein